VNLPTETLDTIRRRLSIRHKELRARLKRIGTDQRREADALSADAPDSAIQRENDEVIDSIGLAADAEVAEIDAALARVDSGVYGTCESCGHPIEPKRLDAVPYARSCLRCISEPDVRASIA
jgi:RNA polymerase-binding transcription factor DksA